MANAPLGIDRSRATEDAPQNNKLGLSKLSMKPSAQVGRARASARHGVCGRDDLEQAHADDACCGARTRTGQPCRRQPLPGSARCRNHGGCSTGPTSAQGKRKVTLNLPRVRKAQDPAS